MTFRHLFIASVSAPKKLAAFRLLPIGRVIRYIFYFIITMTLISFIRYLIGDAGLFEASPELETYSQTIGSLLYPIAIVFQFVIATFYVFVRISLFAAFGMLLGMLFRRRVEYRFIWRTTAVAITLPLLLTMILDFFPMTETFSAWLTSIIHISYIAFALKYYPKTVK